MKMDYALIDNEKAHQYEFHIDGYLAKIEYKKKGIQIFLIHTEVPVELGGRGIGKALVKRVLQDIEQKGLFVIPNCPFVARYIHAHPEWTKLLLEKT